MRTTAIAAFAALVAVAPAAVAGTTGPARPASDASLRATSEARAIVAGMQDNARSARGALEAARRRRQPAEIRCADEALSRADAALRWARDDVSELEARLAARDLRGARLALARLLFRETDSRDAVRMAAACAASDAARAAGVTTVTIRVDGRASPATLL